jgi:hypothetical protein
MGKFLILETRIFNLMSNIRKKFVFLNIETY